MKKRKPYTHTLLRRRIIGLALALWLAAMGLLTWAVAGDMYIQLENKLYSYAWNPVGRTYEEESLPGMMEQETLDNLSSPYYFVDVEQVLPIVHEQRLQNHVGDDDWLWGKWDLFFGTEFGVIYYDENGEPMVQTGNWLTFTYTRDENWNAEDTTPLGYGYVNLDAIEGGPEAFDHIMTDYYDSGFNEFFMPVLRMTGYFEENEFHPTVIDRGTYLSFQGWVDDPAKLAKRDTKNQVEWETLLTAEITQGQELETIYTFDNGGYNITTHPVTVNGTTFDSLVQLMHAEYHSLQEYLATGDYDLYVSHEKESLWDAVLLQRASHTDAYGKYTLFVAVHCKPMQYAALRLIPVYLESFAVVAVCVWWILRDIRKNLTNPLEEMATAANLGTAVTPSSRWSEPATLENWLNQSRETLTQNKTDIQQLKTSLDYAHNAEENRRQLISNITHELKTPLAIIHSYAECLRDGIAEEKREQYLHVILEEAERMDAMVLQMLDLSRLEAGKVRLAADQFSLLELTRSITDRLGPMLEAKNLTLRYGFEEEFRITADESRIGQAITNLLSNALKYTPEGGNIRVDVYLHRGRVNFRVENTAPHLSPEALEKVWDSFYRADPARTEPGTGLGLTLVKTIIELHSGTCTVRNTTATEKGVKETALEFGFSLPLG